MVANRLPDPESSDTMSQLLEKLLGDQVNNDVADIKKHSVPLNKLIASYGRLHRLSPAVILVIMQGGVSALKEALDQINP